MSLYKVDHQQKLHTHKSNIAFNDPTWTMLTSCLIVSVLMSPSHLIPQIIG